MTLAKAESVELCRQARLQGIKKVAGGEEAEEVCGDHSERFGSKWKDRDDTWRQQGQPKMFVLYLIGRNFKK